MNSETIQKADLVGGGGIGERNKQALFFFPIVCLRKKDIDCCGFKPLVYLL